MNETALAQLYQATQTERDAAPPPPRRPTMTMCACGCGETTKGGTYRIGHDARHKSALIRTIIEFEGGPPGKPLEQAQEARAAYEILESRNWMRFLVKSQGVAVARRAKAARPTRATSRHRENTGKAGVERLVGMKAAYDRLREAGRATGSDKIVVTRGNYEDILVATLDEIGGWPNAAGAWAVGDKTWFTFRGTRVDCTILALRGDRVKVGWGSRKSKETRVLEIASLGGELV